MEKREYIHPIQKTSIQHTPKSFFVNQAESKVRANPPTQRLAKKLGVDLSKVVGTGKRGHISKQDVKNYASSLK